MSRIAKAPVDILSGVEISIAGQEVTVKGKNGTLVRVFNDAVEVVQEENHLLLSLVKVKQTVGHNLERLALC